jgi:hypothetical protein
MLLIVSVKQASRYALKSNGLVDYKGSLKLETPYGPS